MASVSNAASDQSTNEGANTSNVRNHGSVQITVGNFSGLQSWGEVTIDGVAQLIAGPTAMNQGDIWYYLATRDFTHDANGYRGARGGSFRFWIDGTTLHQSSAIAPTQPALDYDRKPATATFASITRTVLSIAVVVNTVSSPAGTPTYYVERSENGGAWGDQKTGANVTYSGLALGSTQLFRTWATNSDGTGGTSASGSYSIPNTPSAPTITVSAPSGKALTVTAGVSADNGATVTGYFVQASPDNGATWGTAQAMTSRSFSYTALTGGATYKFRVYSTNEMGNSGLTTSASVFIPSGGRRWNGTALIPTTLAKRWTGTAWVDLTIAKRWTGTAWVDLT